MHSWAYKPNTWVGIAAGSSLRPNNSLAPILGSSGWASGGSGLGSTVPLSCAQAVDDALATAIAISNGIRIRRQGIGSLYLLEPSMKQAKPDKRHHRHLVTKTRQT